MPAQISYLDQEAGVTPPTGHLQPVPLTLGPTWQQNDIRILIVAGLASGVDGNTVAAPMTPDPPTGFTALYNLAPTPGFSTHGVYYRRLVTGDSDTSVTWPKPPGWNNYLFTTITVRGADPNTTPTAGRLLWSHRRGDATFTVSSVTVPAAGEMMFLLATLPDIDPGGWPVSMDVPTGWTHIAATDKSGNTFNPYSVDPSVLVVGKKFASSGTTGTVTVPCGVGHPAFVGMYVFFPPAPDVSTTIGPVTETDTVGAITSSVTTLVSSAIGPVSEVDTVGQVFTGTSGFGLSPVLALTGLPVTGSVVEWTEVTGLPFKVETTINGGASWDTATNGQPVPRLNPEDTETRSVQMRVSAARATAGATSPKLTYLRLAVTDDASTVELVPVGHGVVDKVTRKRASTNAGSGGGGGPGVTGKGGGQSGGGRSLKVHAVDLSKLVSANTWGSAFVIQVGENVADAAVRFLLNRLPGQTQFRVCTTTRVTVEPLIYGLNPTDPWKDLKEFLQPYGLECFFDAAGVFVIRQIPDPAFGVPVWIIDDDAHPVITDLSEELTTEQTINYVTVKGEGTSTKNAVNAIAFDDNPLSDTYILGDFGIHAVTITLPGLETNDQAQTAADAILAGSLSGSQVITISMVPNPALEPGDLTALDLEDTDMSGTFLINGLTWSPSQADTMQLICARQANAA